MQSGSGPPDKPARALAVPRGYALLAALAAVSIAFHASYAAILSRGLTGHFLTAAIAVIAFSGIFALAALIAVVSDARWASYASGGIVALSSLIVGLTLPNLLGLVLEFVALALFVRTVQSECRNRIRISLPHVMAYSSSLGITLALLAVSLMAYRALNQSVASGAFQSRIIDMSVTGFNRTAPLVIKSYSPSMTVDDLIRTQLPTPSELVRGLDLGGIPAATKDELAKRLADEGIDPAKINLDLILQNSKLQEQELVGQVAAKFDELSEEVVDATRGRLSESVGVTLDGGSRVDDALRSVLAARIQRFTVPQLRYVPLILAVTIFLTLALFLWVFSALSVLFARLGLALGKHTGFIVEQEESVTVVRPLLKGSE